MISLFTSWAKGIRSRIFGINGAKDLKTNKVLKVRDPYTNLLRVGIPEIPNGVFLDPAKPEELVAATRHIGLTIGDLSMYSGIPASRLASSNVIFVNYFDLMCEIEH